MHKILFVEDDVAISDMIKSYLANEGFQITIASDGREALEKFHEDQFDLVLLDLMLPQIDGMTVMRKIREKSLIPILIVSAKDSEAELMVLIPLYFGIRKMSVATTILSSLLLVCVVCSGNGGFSLSSIVPVTIGIAAVGVIIGWGVLGKLENRDVL